MTSDALLALALYGPLLLAGACAFVPFQRGIVSGRTVLWLLIIPVTTAMGAYLIVLSFLFD
jgi:hypothetical protein